MRVLYVIDSLAPGGAERSLVEIAPHLVARGIDLRVATLHDRPGFAPALRGMGVPVWSAPPGGRPAKARALAREVRAQRPGLVHTTLFEADVLGRIAARTANVPSVTSFVTTTYGPRPRATGLAADGVDLLTARLATAFHAVSGTVATAMARRLRLRRDHITVIPRGRDGTALGARSSERTQRVRNSLGIGTSAPVILCAARHEHAKGVDTLLSAWSDVMRTLPGAILLLAGHEGARTSELRAAAESFGDQVRMLGHRSDVADLLAASDAVVVPSRREGMSGVIIEAMAIGTPIVATDIEANREASGGHAAFVPTDDARALAEAITRTVGEGAVVATRAARALFEATYRIERVADATVDFYRLNGKGSWTALASTRSS